MRLKIKCITHELFLRKAASRKRKYHIYQKLGGAIESLLPTKGSISIEEVKPAVVQVPGMV